MRNTIDKLLIIFSFIIFFTPATSLTFAQGIGCGKDLGPVAEALCGVGKDGTAKVGGQLNKVFSTLIGLMTIVAALWFMIQFITAGIQWISSGGEKSNLDQARDKITHSLIGLIIVVSAWIVIGLIGKVIGLEILNPGALLETLGK